MYVQFPVTVTVLRVIYSQTKEKNVLFHNEKTETEIIDTTNYYIHYIYI